jgi:hypothetical protein
MLFAGGRLMNSVGLSPKSAACRLLLAAGALATLAAPINAATPKHKYTFNNGNAFDSIGGLNGEVIDNTGISSYTGGALDLTQNNNANSNQDFNNPATVGAYVDLPNGVFTGAVNSGAFGAVTLEIWATPQENRNWARLVDFGTSEGGEDFSTGGNGQEYVIMVPQRDGIGQAGASAHSAGNAENFAYAGFPLPVGVKSHMVAVYDQSLATGITPEFPDGSVTLYVNNGPAVKAAIPAGMLLDFINDNNNWLGRAQWGDPLFDGLIDEFRIYDTALSAAEVAASFTAGPEPAPLPVLTVNRDTGVISLANQSGGGINVKGYSITSAGAALNSTAWTSIDAGSFDPDGTWTASVKSDTNIAEAVTSGGATGGTIAANGAASIGAAWRKTPVQDLAFTFTLGDGSTGAGQIQYTGTAPARSDFNGDGLVNAADWAMFVPNSFTAFAADPAVTAYLKGDLDGDKDNDYADFKLFKADFIAASGEAAFAALGAPVPEPATIALGGLASLALVAARRRVARS